MKSATTSKAKATLHKNLFMFVVLALVGIGFYFLTLVRMGQQPPHDSHPSSSATPPIR